MGTHYSHLSEEQRIKIEVLLRHGASSSAVASYIGCHRSTVYRHIDTLRSELAGLASLLVT